MPNNKLWGLPVTPRFSDLLKQRQQEQSRQQMTHTQSSTQIDPELSKGVPNPFNEKANAVESIMGPGDIIPEAVKQVTGSTLLETASSFLSPSTLVKNVGVGALGIIADAKRTGVLQKVINSATEAEKSGATVEEIFSSTGLWRGPVDKKWRTWLDDSGAKLKTESFGRNQFDSKILKLDLMKDNKVSDVLDHPDLFKRFPWIKDIKVKEQFGGYGGGAYDASTNTIYLGGGKNPNDLVSTLLHEIQHAVQTKHGLTRGGNPNMFLSDPDWLKRKRNAFRLVEQDLQEKLKKIDPTYNKWTKKQPEEILNSIEYKKLQDLNEVRNKIDEVDQMTYKFYKGIGGEAEARAVQEMYMDSIRRNFVGPEPKPGWDSVSAKEPKPIGTHPLAYYDTPLETLSPSPAEATDIIIGN